MNDSKSTVTVQLTAKNPTNKTKKTESLKEMDDKERKKMENREKSQRKSAILHSLSLIMLHILDAILLIILLPFMIWQWISANDRLKIILRAIVEVSLELIMWVIFAGVSVLMTATFVLDDFYYGKSDREKSKQSMDVRKELTPLIDKEIQDISKGQGKPKITEN